MRYVPYKRDRPPWSHWRTGRRWRRRLSCEHWWMSWWTGCLPAGWFPLLGWRRPPLQSSWRKCSHLSPTQTEALLAQVLNHPAHKALRSKAKGLLVPRWRRFRSQPKSFFSCFGLKRFSKQNYCDIHLKLGEMRELSARTIDPYLGNLSRILTSSFLSTSCCLKHVYYIILMFVIPTAGFTGQKGIKYEWLMSPASRNHFSQYWNFNSFPPTCDGFAFWIQRSCFELLLATHCGPWDFCSCPTSFQWGLSLIRPYLLMKRY